MLLSYSGSIALQTARLALFFAIILAVITILAYALDYVFALTPSVMEYLVTLPGILFVTITSLIYAWLRKRRG